MFVETRMEALGRDEAGTTRELMEGESALVISLSTRQIQSGQESLAAGSARRDHYCASQQNFTILCATPVSHLHPG